MRTWHLLSRVAESEDITLLTWLRTDGDRGVLLPVEQTFRRVIAVTYDPGLDTLKDRILTRARASFARLPPYVIARMRRQAIPPVEGPFDVAVAEDDSAVFLLPDIDCPLVVHRHNVFSETIRGLIDSASLGAIRAAKWRYELGAWRRLDIDLARRADLSLVTTPEAADSLRRLAPGCDVEVVPNGVEIPEFGAVQGPGPVAVFVGVMNYEPNVDAVLSFVRRVWPGILARAPASKLRIVGRDPIPAVQRLNSGNIEVTGEVADVVEACRNARVGIVPLNAGSGVKNKTLELMAIGLPVVATPQGHEGILAGPADGLILATSPDDFAAATARLLNDPSEAGALGNAARRFASTLTWDGPAKLYLRLLEETASKASR